MKMDSSSQEHLLPSDPSVSVFQAKVSAYRFYLLLVHSSCDTLVLFCGLLLLFSELPAECDQGLTLWLDIYCGICAFDLLFAVCQYRAKEAPCPACISYCANVLEAIWVLLGVFREENSELCEREVWRSWLFYVAVYCGKLAAMVLFCGCICYLAGLTARKSRIRPLTEAEIQSFSVSEQGKEAELCHCCHQLISTGAKVIRLQCAQVHTFHVLCLKAYLRKRNICPKCFRKLEIGSDFP